VKNKKEVKITEFEKRTVFTRGYGEDGGNGSFKKDGKFLLVWLVYFLSYKATGAWCFIMEKDLFR
jgi:hypothetical protein